MLLVQLFFLIRLPLLIVWILLYGIFYLLSFLLVLEFLKRIVLRIIDFIFFRLILFTMGFYWIRTYLISPKRKSKTSVFYPGNVKRNDIIISNHCSYIELLYLKHRFSPILSLAPNFIEKQIPSISKAKKFPNFLSILKQTSQDTKISPDDCKPLFEDNLGVPIVYFPEGTTTNGLILLGCSLTIPPTQVESQVHLMGFKYNSTQDSPAYCADSLILHALSLCCNVYNDMQVLYVQDEDILKNGDGEILLNILSESLDIRRGKIDATSKHEFLEYYYDYKKNK